tara:strand:+ start:850 stop:1134 length:285 start_codon:yes stop_codon:yes gene_type:complete
MEKKTIIAKTVEEVNEFIGKGGDSSDIALKCSDCEENIPASQGRVRSHSITLYCDKCIKYIYYYKDDPEPDSTPGLGHFACGPTPFPYESRLIL